MKTALKLLGVAALSAAAGPTAAGQTGCGPDTWLADPGISPAVLAANGYRVVTRQTLTLGDGRRAIETIAANGPRRARCRMIYDADGAVDETVCSLPCRDG